MSISFRIAGEADLPALADLRWRLCHEDCAESGDKAGFVEAFCRQVSGGPAAAAVHWMGWQGSRPIGVVSVIRVAKLPSPDDPAGAWGYLTNVYLLPEFRNQGIGSALLAVATDWARQQQLELLLVWPSARSVPFYLRAGFLRGADPLVRAL